MDVQIADQVNVPSVQASESAICTNSRCMFSKSEFCPLVVAESRYISFEGLNIHSDSECFRTTANSLNLITGN